MKFYQKTLTSLLLACAPIMSFEKNNNTLEFSKPEHVKKENLEKLSEKYETNGKIKKVIIDFTNIEKKNDNFDSDSLINAFKRRGRYNPIENGHIPFFRSAEKVIKSLEINYVELISPSDFLLNARELDYAFKNHELRSINMFNVNSYLRFNEFLIKNKNIKNIGISFKKEMFDLVINGRDIFQPSEGNHIFNIIEKNKNIQKISFKNNFFLNDEKNDKKITEGFSKSIKLNNTLEEISFDFCSLSKSNVIKIINAVSMNNSIKTLIFKSCNNNFFKNKIFKDILNNSCSLKKVVLEKHSFRKNKMVKNKEIIIENFGSDIFKINGFDDLRFSFKN